MPAGADSDTSSISPNSTIVDTNSNLSEVMPVDDGGASENIPVTVQNLESLMASYHGTLQRLVAEKITSMLTEMQPTQPMSSPASLSTVEQQLRAMVELNNMAKMSSGYDQFQFAMNQFENPKEMYPNCNKMTFLGIDEGLPARLCFQEQNDGPVPPVDGFARCNNYTMWNPMFMPVDGHNKEEESKGRRAKEKQPLVSDFHRAPAASIVRHDANSTSDITNDLSTDSREMVRLVVKSLKGDVEISEKSAREAKNDLDRAKKYFEYTERSAETMRRMFHQTQSTSHGCYSHQIVNVALKSLKETADLLGECAREAKINLDNANKRIEFIEKSAENMRRVFKEAEASGPRFEKSNAPPLPSPLPYPYTNYYV